MEAEEDDTSPVGLLTAPGVVPGVTCWAQGLARGALQLGAGAGSQLWECSWILGAPWWGPAVSPQMGSALTPGITAPASGHSAPGSLSPGARALQVSGWL